MSLYRKLFEQGKFDRCVKKCRQELQRNPGNLEARFTLLSSLMRQGRFKTAVSEGRETLKFSLSVSQQSDLLNLIGDAFYNQDQFGKALDNYVEADSVLPGTPKTLMNKVMASFQLNRFSQCERDARNLLALSGVRDDWLSHALYYLAISAGDLTIKELLGEYPHMARLIPNEYYHSGMAILCERAKDYESALDHFIESNRLKRARSGYDCKDEQRFFDQYLRLFDASYFEEERFEWEPAVPVPVFIVGMPRSGTSLVEQMLGAHSQIEPLGEVTWLMSAYRQGDPRITNMTPRLAREKIMDRDFCERIREHYLEKISSYPGKYAINKLPANVEKLWLIYRVFPEALIIYTRRDKWPTVWSCFRTNFTEGHGFSESLHDGAFYYDVVASLVEQWRPAFNDSFIEVVYEDLVNQPGPLIDQILARMGLAPEPDCYDPSKSRRIVQTASKTQVLRPVYNDANDNWSLYEKLVARKISGV